ncbi:RNA polymerase factor sigma-54 (plasmid) [Ralstonia syzygii subsp. celebesensis]|uniref:RNA polymerase sigma-54 factor n=3 Tax=Ralstonia solanacearum species complex TaxID=3116862 RepID=A0AAD0WIX1_RALSL|nr:MULTISPECIES: RNA polymerase factor sigma-54 [Ralstonia solanacearum species complex]CCA83662.1 RNA polymerase sigma N (Sigma 54) factor transcription regulator protein [blood disease bacterium R229]AQW32617.1 RNA polymerase factor sigma-54 [blood disease bacterium A2-HR MARDI]AXV84665.1 RNA polymerase factor sigma-54 [Ralstonia solanacearum]AXW55788.1 RNA polymerase factor sigma-54 [Ralstonia solanacearum]QQV58128.1 RNA polymerase factor sigma-54 [Ralstonia syzygii subsp. celebesensis]
MVKAALEMRAKQHLALTPRLQQSVKLLQLSATEFAQEMQEALTSNPFLEEVEDNTGTPPEAARAGEAMPGSEADSAAADRTPPDDAPLETTTSAIETDPAIDASDEFPTDFGSYTSYGSAHHGDGEDNDIGEWVHATPSLREHLHQELRSYRLSERDSLLAQTVIEALDDDGYLRQTLSELMPLAPVEPAPAEKEMQIALALVQSLDPPGVAARDLAECLRLQIEARPADTEAEERVQEIALDIVRSHLPRLAKRDLTHIRRAVGCEEDELREACALIRTLDPRPGLRFSQAHAGYIVPDVIVAKIKGKWVAVTNPAVAPCARINKVYAELFAQTRGHHRTPLAHQLQEARWLIRNAQQRFATIQRVAEAIVAHQKHFLEYGEVAMRPLVLRDVAEELGLHESTISRATGNKFMATPRGIFEFKYFFSRQLATDTGGACSAASVRALLKEMIEAEDAQAPLSDVSLAKMLAEQGVIVARRTVAKYRGLMRIASAELRRQV